MNSQQLGNETTAFFADRAHAEEAAAELRREGISEGDIRLQHAGAADGGFLEGVKRFFSGDGREDDYSQGALLWVNGDLGTTLPILERHGGELSERASGTGTDGPTIILHEERLDIEKTAAKQGEVRVSKEVLTTQKEVDIPVAREEIILNRKRISGEDAVDDGGEIGDGEEISIPVMREEVKVEKHPVITEEVSVEKRLVQQTQHVSATLSKERARLESEGDVGTALNDVE